jgi:phosphatidylserine decarboxylase
MISPMTDPISIYASDNVSEMERGGRGRAEKREKGESTLVRDGYPYVGGLIGLALLTGIGWAGLGIGWLGGVAWVWLALAAFVAFFFRNPEREIPVGEEKVVSPADGLVVVVRSLREGEGGAEFSGGKMVSIFLSVFDVHVNRLPIGGTILASDYRPGKFLVASLERASQENEQQEIKVSDGETTIIFRLIAGLIARRIVCWKKAGDEVVRGERVGLIKFGSRVDLLLPPEVEVLIRKGQRVKGGSSVIGRIKR